MAAGQVDEALLLRALRDEEIDAATYFDSELAREQATALDRYFARPYGDGSEVPNRSQVCTRDIQDAVNWVLPHLLRHFTSSADLISVDDPGLDDDDRSLQDAAAYLRHVLFQDNDGEEVIHDYLFDGFVSKFGVLRAMWQPPEPEPPKLLEGLTEEQVLRYARDGRYQILGGQVDGEVEPDPQAMPQMPQGQPATPGPGMAPGAEPEGQQAQPGPGLMGAMVPQAPGGLMGGMPAPMAQMPMGPQPTFSLIVQRIAHGKVVIEAVSPEDFRIARRAKSLAEASYHGMRAELYLADVIRDYPDKAMELDPTGMAGAEEVSGIDSFGDERLTARFPEELDNGIARTSTDDERRQVVVMIEYIRGDFDRDGVTELRRVKRTGDVILENEVVEESEFSAWSPIKVAHRAIGLSLADTLMDIQKIRTVLTRRAMDSMGQHLMPRLAINKRALGSDPSLLDRLLDHDTGDVIPVDGNPGEVMMPLVTPDVSGSAFQAIEYWDRRSEEASGVNRHAMGIQPQAITDTKGGIDALQAAANSRIEQYVRWAATGLEDHLNKVLRLLIKHQDQARVVKINGRRLSLDPRRWSDEMTVSIHVGMAAESRERRLVYLNALKQAQEGILQQAGPNNPLVTLKHYRATLAKIVTVMGERDPSVFFAEIDGNWQPPDPGPDPRVIEAQAKAQMAQQEAQLKAQADQQKLQMEGQIKAAEFQRDLQLEQARLAADREKAAAELQSKRDLAQMQMQAEAAAAAQKVEIERQIAELRAANEMQIQQMRTEAETALAMQRMQMEAELSRWKTEQQVALRRELGTTAGAGGMASGDESLGSVRFGGDVG